MVSYSPPAATTSLSSKVQLFISCRKLKDLDTFSKSDPVVKIYEQTPARKWALVGSTEHILNNLNPDFKTGLVMDFFFEKNQILKFDVLDDDGGGSFEMIGSYETTLGKIMGSRGQTLTANLLHNGQGNRGEIIVRGDTLNESNKWVQWLIKGEAWPNLDSGCLGMCSTMHPVRYEFCRGNPNVPGQWNCVWQSEIAHNTNNPVFKPNKLSLSMLTNGREDVPFRINIVSGNRTLGWVEATVM